MYYSDNNGNEIVIPELTTDIIGLSMSGGADSSLLAYLFAKKIIEDKSKTVIQPFTRRRPFPQPNPKDWNVAKSKIIVQKIVELLGANVFLPHYVEEQPDGQNDLQTHEQEQNHLEDLHKKLEKLANGTFVYYYGVTANPSIEEMIKHDFLTDERIKDRDVRTIKRDTRPFDLVDKKFIAEIYAKENLLDSLFPLTYSCERFFDDTDGYTKHCGRCWWCKERQWAFGRLV